MWEQEQEQREREKERHRNRDETERQRQSEGSGRIGTGDGRATGGGWRAVAGQACQLTAWCCPAAMFCETRQARRGAARGQRGRAGPGMGMHDLLR